MATATLITSAEFLARPDEFDQSGNRIKEELIAGEAVKMPPRSKSHDITKTRIVRILSRYLDTQREELLTLLVETAFEVTQYDTFIPDVAVLRAERLREEGRLMKGAPEIAIEVVSPTDTANELKRKIKVYLENGSTSVWVFYDDRSVSVHTASLMREFKGEQPVEDPLLPGLSEPVSRYFLP